MTRRGGAGAPEAVRIFLESYFRFYPDHASGRAYPGCDELVPTLDTAAIESLRRGLRRVGELLEGVQITPAGADVAIDLKCLRSELAMASFFLDELNWPATNPLWYVESGIESIDVLDFRDDLDTATRLRLQTRRLAALPQLLRNMEAGLGDPMQPYLDAAIDMLEGFDEHMDVLFADARPDSELGRAQTEARRGIARAHGFLSSRRNQARDFQPMGEERYRSLLAHEHLIVEAPANLIALARRTLEEANAGLRDSKDSVVPPAEFDARGELAREAVLDYYRTEVEAMRQAVIERDLMTIPEGLVEIAETPAHQQALLPGASYLPPPVYGKSRLGHFFISPVPDPMSHDQRRYYHDLVTNRRARNLVVHEVYPGHHLQFLWAAGHPSLIRKVRDNDVMIEGWALYCEHLMREQGLFDEMPSARPWRALRMRAVRVIVDIGIHTGTMTLDEAVDFMQEQLGSNARGWIETEVRRYAIEPTQAMSYVVGRHQVLALREEWRDRVGAGRFQLRDFHNRFLAEGSIPIPLIREKMLGGE